jgi:sugar lactone lactonase YvrE
MQNHWLAKLFACASTFILSGCVLLTDESSSKSFELRENSLVQIDPVLPEVVQLGGLVFDSEGILYFSNYLHTGTIGRYNADESSPPTTFINLNEWMTSYDDRSPNVHGLAMDDEGRLIGADAGTGKIIRVSPDASKVEVLADSYEGMLFGGVQDVALSPDGVVFASSPDEGVIYRIRPEEGKVEILNYELVRADGLAISPDGSRLVVTEPDAARVLVFSLKQETASSFPLATIDFSDSGESPRGLAFDESGRLYVAMGESGSVNVFDLADTRLLRTYDMGGSADRLFIHEGSLWVSGGRSKGVRRMWLKKSAP